MSEPRVPNGWNVLLPATVCTAILAGMLLQHAWPLWTGNPIYLKVRPVDPRDVFRGDYVVLGYDLNNISFVRGDAPQRGPGQLIAIGDWKTEPDDLRYVQLAAQPGGAAGVPGVYEPVSVSEKPVPGAINLCGRVRSTYNNDTQLQLDYGIDAFFVTEGAGKVIEEAMRNRANPVYAEVMVTASGKARLADLMIDGRRVSGKR